MEVLNLHKTLTLDSKTTIRQAIRTMIDEKAYSGYITARGVIIAEVKASDLLRATMEGYSSNTALEKILLGKIFENMSTIE
jgi:CBS domain-containing protein